MQQSGTILPVTNPQPLKRGRRKLNRAIFDVDTAAALRTKAQAEPPTVGTNSPPLPEGTAQQEATGVAISPDPLLKVPADGVPVVRPLVAGDVAEEQLRYQSKEVSCQTFGTRVPADQERRSLGRTLTRSRSCRSEPHSRGRSPATRGACCDFCGLRQIRRIL